MASELKVNKISPESGTTLTLGDSGDTINFGSGVLPNFENLTVTGDLTVDTNSLKVDSTNNFVGIGTATPSVALDVVGAITATGNITGTLATAAQPNITSLGTLTGLTTTGNINLGDNDVINVGASNDLQIYHNGSHSYIADTGTGNLFVQGTNIELRDSAGYRFINCIDDGTGGTVELYDNASKKLETTSTGIDVTGIVVSDGLTVDNGIIYSNSTTPDIRLIESDTTDLNTQIRHNGGELVIRTLNDAESVAKQRLKVDHATGDISFYEDTGTTPKFFWDASAESLGIGTSSPASPLHINYDGTAMRITRGDAIGFLYNVGVSASSNFRLQSNGGGLDFYYGSNGNVTFTDNGTERMRIDSSGILKIGTSGTATPYVHSKFAIDTGLYSYMDLISTGSSGINFGDAAASQIGSIEYSHSANYLRFITNGSERMRIDSSGNVGIGNTLYALSSSQLQILFGGIGSLLSGTGVGGTTEIRSNSYYNSANQHIYQVSDEASRYKQTNGTHNFDVAPTGTAGGVVTWTNAMSIDNSGNVGIGTSSPDNKLHVQNGDASASSNAFSNLTIESSSSINALQFLSPNTAQQQIRFGDPQDDGAGYIAYNHSSSVLSIGVAGPEKMRITSAGRVGIGTSSPDTQLHIAAANSAELRIESTTTGITGGDILGAVTFETRDANSPGVKAKIDAYSEGSVGNASLRFFTGDTVSLDEAMRIDSSGNLLVGKTSSGTGNRGVEFTNLSLANPRQTITSTGTGPETKIEFRNGNGYVGEIYTNGSNTIYLTSSDYRLKENVVDMTGATERLKQLQPKRFNFIADADIIVDGFLAHEVSDIVPEAIKGTKDEIDADGNPVYQGIDQSKLVPLLVATIKELEARITTLENA